MNNFIFKFNHFYYFFVFFFRETIIQKFNTLFYSNCYRFFFFNSRYFGLTGSYKKDLTLTNNSFKIKYNYENSTFIMPVFIKNMDDEDKYILPSNSFFFFTSHRYLFYTMILKSYFFSLIYSIVNNYFFFLNVFFSDFNFLMKKTLKKKKKLFKYISLKFLKKRKKKRKRLNYYVFKRRKKINLFRKKIKFIFLLSRSSL